jgi:hypothetical protein
MFGTVTLTGARPGVDGTFWIMNAEHWYSRMGYITTLDVYGKPVESTRYASDTDTK